MLLFQLVDMNIYWKQSLRDVPGSQLKSENIETLYLLSALKEPVQIDYKKAIVCIGVSSPPPPSFLLSPPPYICKLSKPPLFRQSPIILVFPKVKFFILNPILPFTSN